MVGWFTYATITDSNWLEPANELFPRVEDLNFSFSFFNLALTSFHKTGI